MQSSQITDSHCHLEQFEDPETVLSEATDVGVGRVVTMGQDEESMRQALKLASRFPDQVLVTVQMILFELVLQIQ